jgi:Zn-dependent peptidase ImmA (M78 family)
MNIKKKAQEILSNFKNFLYPVDVIAIASHYNITVFSDTSLSDYQNGCILVNDNEEYEIIINKSHSVVRQRFTVAHEIAHYIFDRDYLDIHKSIDRDGDAKDHSYRHREIRANKFASELLMPEERFIDIFLELKNIDTLANYFLVSKNAIKFRAMNLGLLIE